MAAQPVEWVLIVHYGPAAHQPTYGRQVKEGGYTKDYIQLSRKQSFLAQVAQVFSVPVSAKGSVPLTYKWPGASAPGAFVFRSADRPHLKWETKRGAPMVWKMALSPSDSAPETIPGDPTHRDFKAAENEFKLLSSRGAGQPYLMAIKLRDEPRTLHLRAYLRNPGKGYGWADLRLVPQEVQALAAKTTQRSALAWSLVQSEGTAPTPEVESALSQLAAPGDRTAVIGALDRDTGRALVKYLRRPGRGLFFDPTRNHDAWRQAATISKKVMVSVDDIMQALQARFPAVPQGDAAAEALEVDPEEVEDFRIQISQNSYAVADLTVTTKIRGSAQRAFAEAVKANYGSRCAITGIATKDFLVAAHIVPWSADHSIRLDPSNGICLSLVVDRAFEKGYLLIDDDLTVRIDRARVGTDHVLCSLLEPHDGRKLQVPSEGSPRLEYLRRRRTLVTPTD